MHKLPRFAKDTVPLAERISKLNVKRQEIIRPIVEHPREFVLLSVRALAKRLQTDPATIIRIVHGLEFGSYKEFQHHLHELSLVYATSQDTMLKSQPGDGKHSAVTECAYADMKNLQGFKNSLEPARFTALAKRIYAARRVVLIGGDMATVLVSYLEYQLNLLGLPIFAATTGGAISHAMRAMGKKDLLIAISFRRGLRQTVEGIQQARERGAYCVGITDTYLSPLARTSHEVFLGSTDSVYYGSSYVAPIALANAILTAVGEFKRPRTLAIVEELADEQRRGSRWFGS
jgi:RpiR family carbohydrate utilization transcriptional regulator